MYDSDEKTARLLKIIWLLFELVVEVLKLLG